MKARKSDPLQEFDNHLVSVGEKFSNDVQYENIIDWLDNGGVNLEEFGIELTREQRLVLKCFDGVELDEEDEYIINKWKAEDRTTYDFEIGERKRNALVLDVGRRAGKTLLCSLLILYVFEKLCRLSSPQKHFKVASNTLISITCLATSASSGDKTIYGQVCSMVPVIPYIKSLVDRGSIRVMAEEWEYKEKNLYIYRGNSEASNQLGSSTILLVMDEGNFYKPMEDKDRAIHLWTEIGAAGISFGENAMRVIISSASHEGDATEKLYETARVSDNYIAFRLRSWDINPVMAARDNPFIEDMYKFDLEEAERLCEGVRKASKNAAFDGQKVAACFTGISDLHAREMPIGKEGLLKLEIVRIDRAKIRPYRVMHLDPAVVDNNYGLAYGYAEKRVASDGEMKDFVIIEGLLCWQPKYKAHVSFMNVNECILNIHKHKGITHVSADDRESNETLQRLKAAGLPQAEKINFTNAQQVKMYQATKNLINEGRLILPKNSKWSALLLEEFQKVELLNNNKIDHPPGGCFVGETRIPLLDGSRPTIAELEGKEVWVYSSKPDGTIVPGKARGRKTKMTRDLVDVVLDTGAVVRCTPEHRFMLRNGLYIEAQAIIPGVTRLMPIHFNWPSAGGYEKVSGIKGKFLTHHIAAGYPDLTEDLVVHHKNGIKTDNRPENLEVIKRSDHSYQHTVEKHQEDLGYRKKLSEGTVKFNKLESTRKKRSDFRKSLPNEYYKEQARNRQTFRNEVSLQDLLKALSVGCENAHQAATFLNYSRNLVIRVLKDNNYKTWDEFQKDNLSIECTDDRFKLISSRKKIEIPLETIRQAVAEGHTKSKDLCRHLGVAKHTLNRRLNEHGYKGVEDFIRNGFGQNHKARDVIKVQLDEAVAVYDLEVDTWDNFALSGGVVVHNSKDLYDCVVSIVWKLVGEEYTRRQDRLMNNILRVGTKLQEKREERFQTVGSARPFEMTVSNEKMKPFFFKDKASQSALNEVRSAVRQRRRKWRGF